MQLYALGLNHHTAPLSIRERVAFQPEHMDEALGDLVRADSVREAAILSTCNRTELYFAAERPQQVANWLAQFHRVALDDMSPYLYAYPQRDAVRHVFRVASGLDSMVLGEPQILGQVKDAVRRAEQAGTMGTLLHKLFQNTFAVAKEVRSTTAIGASTVSMAAAAVHLSARIFERVSDQHVLFIGAGEMIELCAAHFAGARPKSMTVANRTEERAAALASRFGANTMRIEQIADQLPRFDIVVSCTAAPLPIVGLGMAERAIRARRRKPMVMVDLAVPRDIEAEIAQLDDVFLYTVDDLANVVDAGVESRQQAVIEAEQIIDTRVDGFLHWVSARDSVPAIRALRDHAESLRQFELERALRLLAKGNEPAQVLEALSRGLTNKLMHGPTRYLHDGEGVQAVLADQFVQRVFNPPGRH